MAFTSNVTYNGKIASEFIAPALLENAVLGRFSLLDGVKNTITVPKVTTSGWTVTETCSFVDGGTETIDPRILSICKYKINREICYSDIEPTFLSERLRAGANSPVLPDDFRDFLVNRMVQTIGNDMQDVAWNGDTGATTSSALIQSCEGLIVKFGASGSGVVGLTGATAAALSTSNVQFELGRVYAAVPETVKSSGQPWVIFASQNIVDLYKLSLAATTGGLFSLGDKPLDYLGVEIVPTPKIPSGTMVAANPTNLWVGTDLLSDETEIKILDMGDTLGYNAARLVAHWKFGVQFGVGAEIVWYKH